MRLKKLFMVLAVALALAATLLPLRATASSPTKIIIAEATRGEGWLPVYLAHELGYFADEGLEAEFVTYKDGPLAQMGLLRGDAQFCLIGFEPVLMAFEKGQASKVIMTTLFSQPYTFAVSPGLTAKDFKGKVVFAGMPGSAPYFFVRTIIKNAGLDPDKDVTFASLEYGAELVALSRGDISGAYVRATRIAEANKAGASILVDTTRPEDHKAVYGSDRYEAMDVQVSNSFIKEHPETVQAFANAVSRAMAWTDAHGDEEVARMVSPLFPGRNIDAQLISVLRRCLSSDGLFTEGGYKAVIDFCLANGVVKTAPTMAEAVDQTFMTKAKANRK